MFYNIERLEGMLKSLSAKIRSREVQLLSFIYNYLGFQPRELNNALIEKLLTVTYVEPKFYVSKDDGFTYTHDTRMQMMEAGVLEDFNALYDNMKEISTEHSKAVKVIQRSYDRKVVEGNSGPLM